MNRSKTAFLASSTLLLIAFQMPSARADVDLDAVFLNSVVTKVKDAVSAMAKAGKKAGACGEFFHQRRADLIVVESNPKITKCEQKNPDGSKTSFDCYEIVSSDEKARMTVQKLLSEPHNLRSVKIDAGTVKGAQNQKLQLVELEGYVSAYAARPSKNGKDQQKSMDEVATCVSNYLHPELAKKTPEEKAVSDTVKDPRASEFQVKEGSEAVTTRPGVDKPLDHPGTETHQDTTTPAGKGK